MSKARTILREAGVIDSNVARTPLTDTELLAYVVVKLHDRIASLEAQTGINAAQAGINAAPAKEEE